ncbi:ring-cleaving dioxygenase [Sabulicella rubraurantiaca]|uniref:ring-cleaving dioxygenase n=1 Tax=Sabulicella rubraurantiaca TaxID=2811429 RepID=UPI001A97BEF0|nr:ring-cleaving dioxygenase [Sabulicella rubraurantiaca]
MHLYGIHHLTAITADARNNHDFYTRVLGMRLVKKTVNQDDTSVYHLFYGDGVGSPGTGLTFFDWQDEPEHRGTNSIVRTALRVSGANAMHYWTARFENERVPHGPVYELDGRRHLDFEDPEGQRLTLVEDDRAFFFHPWSDSPVPAAHQIQGLGPVTISVRDLEPTDRFLTRVMAMHQSRSYVATDTPRVTVQVYEMGEGGLAAELHVRADPDLPPALPGAGGVHHVAFRIPDASYHQWVERLGVRSSGPVNRFWFRSLYARDPNGILYEVATDGPGFAVDEPVEALGEKLVLPPFLEPRRAAIESKLKPIQEEERHLDLPDMAGHDSG